MLATFLDSGIGLFLAVGPAPVEDTCPPSFDLATATKSKPTDEVKLSGLIVQDSKASVVLKRTDVVAKLYHIDLMRATNILGSKWDDATATLREGIAQVGVRVYAVANDNDFDVGSFDANGNNVGVGAKKRIFVVSAQSRTFLPLVGK